MPVGNGIDLGPTEPFSSWDGAASVEIVDLAPDPELAACSAGEVSPPAEGVFFAASSRRPETGFHGPIASYDPKKAVQYALRWSDNERVSYGSDGKPDFTRRPHNPDFPLNRVNDCTNFVSQCLHAGGWPIAHGSTVDENRLDVWDHNLGPDTRVASSTWMSVPYFLRFAKSRSSPLAGIYDVREGDVVLVDYTGDREPDHAAIVTGIRDAIPLLTYHSRWKRNYPLDRFAKDTRDYAAKLATADGRPVPTLHWFALRMSR